MSGDDELERLLREVDASLSGGAQPPASRAPAQPARTGEQPPGRFGRSVRVGTIAGVLSGVVVGTGTFLLSWLPFVDNPFSSGAGAFVGAFATGAVLTAARR